MQTPAGPQRHLLRLHDRAHLASDRHARHTQPSVLAGSLHHCFFPPPFVSFLLTASPWPSNLLLASPHSSTATNCAKHSFHPYPPNPSNNPVRAFPLSSSAGSPILSIPCSNATRRAHRHRHTAHAYAYAYAHAHAHAPAPAPVVACGPNAPSRRSRSTRPQVTRIAAPRMLVRLLRLHQCKYNYTSTPLAPCTHHIRRTLPQSDDL